MPSPSLSGRGGHPRRLGLVVFPASSGQTSPLFEGGSHLALWSGREAAQTIAAAISEGDLSDAKMQRYVKAWKKRFPPYHKILKGKTSLYDLSDKELSNMARCLPEELGSMSVLDKLWIGLKILVSKHHLKFLILENIKN